VLARGRSAAPRWRSGAGAGVGTGIGWSAESGAGTGWARERVAFRGGREGMGVWVWVCGLETVPEAKRQRWDSCPERRFQASTDSTKLAQRDGTELEVTVDR
jgi:hypothetical protein